LLVLERARVSGAGGGGFDDVFVFSLSAACPLLTQLKIFDGKASKRAFHKGRGAGLEDFMMPYVADQSNKRQTSMEKMSSGSHS
jgi:hypothetical protein